MNDPALERDPIETLASEFTDRLRAGERPSVQEYIDGNPHVADEIRDLFPTIAAMEKLKSHKESRSGGRASLGPTRLQQLGDFRIIREIGRGGMGIVYEAEQLSLGRRVAVKVLPKQSLLDEKHLMRFRREAKTAARLHHTNIVPVLGVGEHDGFHFIVMQYIRGVGLDEIIPHLATLGSNPATNHDESSSNAQGAGEREVQISLAAQAIFEDQFRGLAATSESSIVQSLTGLSDGASGELPQGELAESGSIGFEVGAISQSTRNSRHQATRSFASLHDNPQPADQEPLEGGERSDNGQHGDGAQEEGTHGEEAVSDAIPASGMRVKAAYWRSVAKVGAQVAAALQYAHEHGTLHRDIKPGNLLIDQQGVVWVADFGLAKAMEQDDVSRTGDIVGTLRYMAPEQLYGGAESRSDIYSLGLSLYEMLTFRPAYDEADRKKCLIQRTVAAQPPLPRRVTPGVPRDLETIVLKAIADDPARRYATAAEMADDLERFLEDRPIHARRATQLEHFWRWCRRNPAVASLSGIAISLLILVAIVSTTAYVRTRAANEATKDALAAVDLQRQKAEATSNLAWNALDRIFARFAPQSVVSNDLLTLETEEGVELAVETPVVLSDQAAALLQELLTFYDRLAEQGDNDFAFQRRIADANHRVGAIQHRLGRTEQAEAAYLRAIEIYTSISAPANDPSLRVVIATLHNELGMNFANARRISEASAEYGIARSILEPLAASNNSQPDVRYELAHTYYLQSWPSLGARRRGPPRVEDLNKAIELLEHLRQQDPDVPEYQQLLAMCYVERAERASPDENSFVEAINHAVTILKSLVDRFPNNPDFRFALATAYRTAPPKIDERSSAARRDEIARLLEAQFLLQELQREHPNVPEYVEADAQTSERMGKLCSRIFDFDQAIEHLEAGLKTQEGLVRRNPSAAKYQIGLYFMRKTYADELRSQHDWTEDPILLEKALEQLSLTLPRSLKMMRSDGDPRMKEFVARGVVNTYHSIADLRRELGDEEGAVAALQSAEQLQAQYKIGRSRGPRGPGNGSRREGRGDGPRGEGDRNGRPRGGGPPPAATRPGDTSPAGSTSPDDTSPDDTSPDDTSPDDTSPDDTSPDDKTDDAKPNDNPDASTEANPDDTDVNSDEDSTGASAAGSS